MKFGIKDNKTYYGILMLLMIVFAINIEEIDDFIDKYKSYEGVVIEKRLNEKTLPEICLKGRNGNEWYGIDNVKMYEAIEQGNYIIKQKGNNNIKLIKDRDTIIFKNHQ